MKTYMSYSGRAGHLYHLLTGKDHPKATKSFRNSLTDKSGLEELREAKKEFDKQITKNEKTLEEIYFQGTSQALDKLTQQCKELCKTNVTEIHEHNYCELCNAYKSVTSIALGTPDNFVDVCKSCEGQLEDEELDVYRNLEDSEKVDNATPLGTEFEGTEL